MATDLLFIDGLCIICGQDKRLCPGHQKKALVRKIRELMAVNEEFQGQVNDLMNVVTKQIIRKTDGK